MYMFVCDRCGKEIKENVRALKITNRMSAGVSPTLAEIDLCQDCWIIAQDFMIAHKRRWREETHQGLDWRNKKK